MYGPPEIRSDGVTPAVYGTVYYPGALSKDKASLLDLAAGQHLTGIDIHLARTRTNVTIGGRVTGLPENSMLPNFVTVQLYSSGNAESFHMARQSPAETDGKFTIPRSGSGSISDVGKASFHRGRGSPEPGS